MKNQEIKSKKKLNKGRCSHEWGAIIYSTKTGYGNYRACKKCKKIKIVK